MNKTKLLGLLVGLLVLLNVAILSYLFLNKQDNRPPRGPHNPEMRAMRIIERFDFDDTQIALFEKSKDKHVEKSKELYKQLEEASVAYYNHSEINATKDSLYAQVESITQLVYKANDIHFNEVRKICNQEQLSKMDEFIKSLVSNNKGPRGERRMKRE